MSDVIEQLQSITTHVDKAISEMLPIAYPDELYKASRYLPDAGGKRLRPATLVLAAQAVGSNLNDVLPAAVSVELVHNFTLIHDDIMDEDSFRRGMEAVHVKWGLAGAILAGDTLYSKAFEILAGMDNDPARLNKCIELLSQTCTQICEGQWMDIEFEHRDDVTKEEYLEMVEKKTSVLYAAAAKSGAILGGASDEVANSLYDFGRLIGVGFQIYDDVLDLITPEDVLGKVRGSDLMEGKKTLIALHAINNGVDLKIFGKGSAEKSEIEEAVKVLEESGSIDYAQELAFSYIQEGKEKLKVLPDSDSKATLLEIADYMIERKY
ncbi:Farnesyltranstransferase [Methanosalsum zhilinae DSM 4017]|uniref:Farnesyltranstransferase n=1 Tax=Methanosalsum zhilinae (strain DSM 4017 / NBRC 107636 / OCM 62 / WeN5) TaxID=679901 RepID=F7XLQ9_METZD|nr:Farnesyltranstransferase [Methanosalsum zhilinae DSM 4017]